MTIRSAVEARKQPSASHLAAMARGPVIEHTHRYQSQPNLGAFFAGVLSGVVVTGLGVALVVALM